MELKLDIKYDQLLKLVQQLPPKQIMKLQTALDEKIKEEKTKAEISDFQKLLLSGPVMSDEQYKIFLKNREHFNQWHQK